MNFPWEAYFLPHAKPPIGGKHRFDTLYAVNANKDQFPPGVQKSWRQILSSHEKHLLVYKKQLHLPRRLELQYHIDHDLFHILQVLVLLQKDSLDCQSILRRPQHIQIDFYDDRRVIWADKLQYLSVFPLNLQLVQSILDLLPHQNLTRSNNQPLPVVGRNYIPRVS